MLIESKNGLFRAVLEECDEGVQITFFCRSPHELSWKSLYQTVFDVPWHVASDGIIEIIEKIEFDARGRGPASLHVISINGISR